MKICRQAASTKRSELCEVASGGEGFAAGGGWHSKRTLCEESWSSVTVTGQLAHVEVPVTATGCIF